MSEEQNFFPLFVSLDRKKCLVVGAGKIAYRKTMTLLKYGAVVEVVGKKIMEKKFFSLNGSIEIFEEEFKEKYLEDKFLVCAATDDIDLNLKIVELCNKKNILVNNATSKTEMNCRFCTSIETEEYQIGISAKGNPKRALELKKEIEKWCHM
jgi:precorrin-2 dehydrogenase/sirohydrochlorin ferrochelatase